ncbi:tail protein X [Thiotrichales bacterium 19S3-7]|nr:tail protein X [Thiotrichales bacterium 19S3-7]MCF6776898.1 tail protein X [Thiotrichales bacterium 19X7-9]MCF6802574.1 tail protein X [Thiotrichales bacterium 19S3-11]
MAKYITKTGDMLDDICYQYYGTESVTFKVLEANRDLADLGEILPSGIEIELPDFPPPERRAVKLWE